MGDDIKGGGSHLTKAVEAEALQPKSKVSAEASAAIKQGVIAKSALTRRNGYRPSHKATFFGIIGVVVILLINAGVVVYIISSQEQTKSNNDSVTIGPVDLENLGVSRNTVGNVGSKLVVGPDATFNGKVTVADTVSISGDLELNSQLSAASASFQKLQTGDTSVSQLNVNGDSTASNVNIREKLAVIGNTTLQGPVNMSQLLTVSNNASIAGNLAVGGVLSINQLRATSLQSDATLTIGGRVITQGAPPSVGPGGAVGSNGTVSISGNDISGSVAINVGTGASAGTLASIGFRSSYSNTPHVVISAVGRSAGSVYVNRTPSGFTINTSAGLSPGGYVFDYIVVQ